MVVVEKDNKDFLKHLEALSNSAKTAISVQHIILNQTRRKLEFHDFVEVLAPVNIFEVNTKRKPLSDLIIYKQTLIRSFEKIFTLSPIIKETPKFGIFSSNNLFESYQLDLEMKETSMTTLMETTELLLEGVFENVNLVCAGVLEDRDREFVVPSVPFPRITYSDLHDLVSSVDSTFIYGEEIPSYVKEEISKRSKKPFWITNYPIGAREILYREDPKRPEYLLSMDLIYPEGFGEAASGGEREVNDQMISAYLRRSGEDVTEYQFYLEMMKKDGKKSSGISIGIERLLRFILG